jgi:hypothetical protein
MGGSGGNNRGAILAMAKLDPATVETSDTFRLWDRLDANTRAAIEC